MIPPSTPCLPDEVRNTVAWDPQGTRRGIVRWGLVLLLAGGCLGMNAMATSLSAPSRFRRMVDQSVDEQPAKGQLFEGMGDWHREFSTDSPTAQRYLDQGFIWLQSFNHDEAIRSFQEALHHDPECAIAWWGISFAHGPNYNDPMMNAQRQQSSWEALQKALGLIEHASPWEQDLIHALEKRYEHPFPQDRTHLEKGFAQAMKQLWEKYPEDADIGALYAEAEMDCRPWLLYTPDREPEEGTEQIVATLERVLKLQPNHPGACHLYIHAVEQSQSPERALEVADRLVNLVPASGHMRHMASHIYTRVNQWNRSIQVNVLAMEADDQYRKKSPEQSVQYMYMIHNNHILAYSAMMVGRKAEALRASRLMWEIAPEERLKELAPFLDMWMCSLYDVQKRFGLWEELISEPAPPEYLPLTVAHWRAHRSVAFAAMKKFDQALEEYGEFEKLYNNPPPVEQMFPGWTFETYQKRLDAIRNFVPGEIALQRDRYDLAAMHLERAVKAEDELGFGGEPPEYLQPIRHTLGAVYYKLERFEDAERIFQEDLSEFPGNGWSLYGLSRAQSALGKEKEAAETLEQYQTAWQEADVPALTTSCECIETF